MRVTAIRWLRLVEKHLETSSDEEVLCEEMSCEILTVNCALQETLPTV